MIPQIALNYKRRSVDGLSFLWASANFIAAFVNLNFALRLSLPLYVTAMAIYIMPVLEAIILGQNVVIPLFHERAFWLISDRVEGLPETIQPMLWGGAEIRGV